MDEIFLFITYIRSEKGLTKNTIDAYSRDVNKFSNFLLSRKKKSFKDSKIEDFLQYLEDLKINNYASSSIARFVVAIKVFYRFLKKENIIKDDISKYLDFPKVWQILPDVMTEKEVERLLLAPDTATYIGARDKAIIDVLYSTGIRVSELCNLLIKNVDDKFIKILGKGNKERIVPIAKIAINSIDYYLTNFRKNSKSKFLFTTRSDKKITRINVWLRIKKYVKMLNILKKVSPHTLRHSFATHLLENGADIRLIQDMLGHLDISTTDKYTHISKSHLKKAFDNFHPRP